MGQVTVFGGLARRRRWSDEERLQILGEAFAPGALVAQVARRHDVSTGLISRGAAISAGVLRRSMHRRWLQASPRRWWSMRGLRSCPRRTLRS